MRCSSSERHLSAYVDGDLGPVLRARVAQHLESCPSCTAIADELRSLDALLLSTREIDLAPNFSFVVMAEVRSVPAPHAQRSRPFAVLATYVVFAWSAIGAFLIFGGSAARAMLATLSAIAGRFVLSAGALSGATGRLFGRHTFDVTAAMGGLLALDLVVAASFIGLYALARGRRTATFGGPQSW